ncbi:MAG: sigma-70 family RNA polymerase sigma factor [Oscillospiraceae bacterium]|nr:sigma-70 family RNA polymerase sigma factor [Oscillospiraceae bacterium]
MTDEKFAEKLEMHKNTVYRLAFSYLKNIQDAEDVTQEAFLKFYRCDIDFSESENEKAWLIRVTANLCRNYFRANRFKKLVPFDENTAQAPVFMQSDLETLDLLSALKPSYRTVLYLFYYEKYRTSEIAKILGRNENTIRTQLARGRERLREILTDTETQGGIIYGK